MSNPTGTTGELTAEQKRLRLAEMLRKRAGETRSYPLSFAQQRLWFLDRLDPGSSSYNLTSALRLEGELRPEVLQRALREMAQRHASLRTVFSTLEAEPVQVVAPTGDLPLAAEDLSALPDDERRARVRAAVAEETRRPFDLARGPLARATLLRLAEREHVFLVSMHHIVTDGWSTGVFFRELAALYTAFARGEPSPLPELPIQYPDFAVWQRRHLAGDTLERQLAYWRDRLAGAPPVLDLPTDRPRPPLQTQHGAKRTVAFPAALTSRLRELGHAEGATLFMTVLAAFQALLARYSGQDDLVVGTPIAGRTRPELEGLVGFFVNTLALRADLSGDPTFRELLRRVRETTLAAYAHQDLPFEKLVEELKIERSLSHSPVFQTMFTLQSAPGGPPGFAGLAATLLEPPSETARFDLELALVEHAEGLHGALVYNTDLFDAPTADRFAEHLRVLLESAAARPDARLSELPVLPADERRRLLAEWNDTARPYPAACAHELFAEQARRTPDAVAVVGAGGERLTYAELDRRAGGLAGHLRGRGVGPEVPVGICLERGPEMLVAVLGVLKAGGAYVPLDPSYPAERLRFVGLDAGIRLLVTRRGLAGVLPDHGAEVVHLDDVPAGEADRGGAAPENLAYVIYTSGSTGRPKGVRIEHRSLSNLLLTARDTFGLGPGTEMPALSSYAFDIWAFEALAPLVSGGTVRVVPRERVLDTEALLEELEGATALHAVPALMRQIVGAVRASRGTHTGMRRVFVGGDAVPPDLLAEMREAFPDAETRVMYGPTEATIVAASHHVSGDGPGARLMIGAPLGNVRLYVLDRSGGPAPIGVSGELCIGGAGVARDYLGRPELTADKFVPDPFSGDRGARLYRTGDRAHWRPDGTLEFLGRTDDQVKIRGFRIEPGEVEAVLAQAPGVAEAVVVARRDVPGEVRLVGYVAAAEDARPTPADLRAFLKERLPEHMVPAALVVLDDFPLTPTGKVDRRALPAPEGAAPLDAERFVAPRTPTEELLAGIWAEVLGRDLVGARDSFFEMGGHSLLATRVASRVRSTLGVTLPVRAVFEAPTVAELAERADALLRAGEGIRLPPLAARGPTEGDFPLSFAQERLWVLHQLDPGSGAYNMPFFLRLEGSLDAAALRATLDALVARHPALRTAFPGVGDNPVQRVAAPAPAALAVEDLTGHPTGERRERARALATEEARRPFDLAGGPLFRAVLLRLAEDEHHLLLSLHHIVGDGWSMDVLFREFAALYAAFHEGRPSPLPEPAIRYTDYSVWQREWLSGEVLERQSAWWRGQLEGAPPVLDLPTDRPRPPVQTTQGAEHRFALAPEVREGLHALARREGATLFMTLLAAFQALLAKYTGQPDVVVGTPVAGRTHEALEGVVGFFVNTLALRGDLSGDPSFRQILGRAREATLGAHAHQDLPFEKLVEELHPERSTDRNPVFQVMLTVQSGGAPVPELPGVAAHPLEAGSYAAKFDLTLEVGEDGDRLVAGLGYATALFDAATVERMAGHLRTLLERVVARPEARLAELSLLGPEEERRLLVEWNATRRDYPEGRCVHDLFAAQARRTPEAVALRFRGEDLTYAELERRANRLANRLRGLGVGPETRVGVFLERAPELVVALLGILKAGGAYVPLDPSYPRERLRGMLEDARVSLVLTTGPLAGRLPEGRARVVALDAERERIEAEPGDAPESGVTPENLSHLIFTSGSTGRPKGVMIRHSSTVVLLHWLREAVSDEERSAVLFSTSINFDVSVAEVFGTLCWGGRLVMVENALELAALSEPVVHVSMVPTAAAELLRAGGIPASVRTLNLGGEPLPNDLAQALYALGTVDRVGNLYGPTEDTTYSTYSLVERGGSQAHVGRPVANTQAYVLDAELRPVPVGVIGELYLAGDGLARGYADRPDLTAERFLPNPFGAPGSRMYRVMDRMRWRADGELEYFGRTDFQVKVRGFRIELGEIESVLRAHTGVEEAVVLVREDTPGDRRLVAYLTAAGAESPSPADLRLHTRGVLPDYMVPSTFVAVDAFPLTPSGKTDRRALPAPGVPVDAGDGYAAPRGAVEEILAGIWADVLGAARVGVRDDFFDLGGHSLLATQVVSRVRAVFRVDVPVRAVFEAPTVAELARRVEARVRAGQAVELPPLARVPRDGDLPLSFAQERLWVIDRLDPGSSAYNVPLALRLRGELDVDALRATLDALTERHEPLRTVFPAVAGRPVQRVLPAEGAALRVEVLDAVAEAAREAEALRVAAEEAWRPFDLSAGPLFRATLLRIRADDHLLVLAQHHSVTDGWSMGVLFRELSAVYAAIVGGGPSPLRELPVQYADFAVWQRGWLTGEILERQVAYWRERLSGAPSLIELPTDRPRRAVQTTRGASHRFHVPRDVVNGVAAVGRREGATLFMSTLAAFQLFLSRHSGQEDVVVGTPIAGRTHEATEALVGFFVNTLALRLDLSRDPTFRELLGRVRETTLGAYAHQDLPFEKLVEEIQPERDVTHAPVFQVVFTLQNLPARPLHLPGLTLSVVETESRTTKFDLSLGVVETPEGLHGGFEYNADLFDAATIERMAERFSVLLERIAERPGDRISTLSPIGDAERRQILEEWSGTGRDYPPELLHERIAETARISPAATAVIAGDAVLTYGELDVRASRLAHHLRRHGVGPEVQVGICVERGAEMVVAAVAVLRAGGAYLPLDPTHPPERLALMLEDARVPVLVTDTARADRFASATARLVLVDRDRALIDAEPGSPPESGVGPDNLAYVIYTSGSTGRPKGVAVSHRNLAYLLRAGCEAFAMAPDDVTPSMASWAFDIWVFEALIPLASGGVAQIVPRERVADVQWLVGEIAAATTVHTVPALMRQIVAAVRRGAGALPRLRNACVGGDAVPPDLLAEMREVFPEAAIAVLYGPTEATVACSAYLLPERAGPGRQMIGRPLPGTRLYVLDRNGEPVPAGVAGELYIGGPGVSRGYSGRPELTAEKFVPDPFGGEPGARLYRTGDRVRWLPDGSIEFLGRTDNQVKIRGFRVEPGEIESVLARHPDVRDATALVREDAPGDGRLVAYLEADPDAREALVPGLRALLRETLPEYMVPSAFVVLERFPLTPTGKIDRRALPAPDVSAPGDGDEAPGTEMERTVARVWEEVLGITGVGTGRSFFDVGGNSLVLVQVAARLEAELGRPVPVIDLFQHTTVAALARHLGGEAGAGSAPAQTGERAEQLARGKGRLGQLLKRKQNTDK